MLIYSLSFSFNPQSSTNSSTLIPSTFILILHSFPILNCFLTARCRQDKPTYKAERGSPFCFLFLNFPRRRPNIYFPFINYFYIIYHITYHGAYIQHHLLTPQIIRQHLSAYILQLISFLHRSPEHIEPIHLLTILVMIFHFNPRLSDQHHRSLACLLILQKFLYLYFSLSTFHYSHIIQLLNISLHL